MSSTLAVALGLVVPLYNEADRFDEFGPLLVDFVSSLPAGSELIFVDDGSTDATVQRVEALRAAHPGSAIELLCRPHAGKGAAVASGLAAVTAPYGAFCDLDLSTPLEHLARVVQVATRADVLAVGSRDLAASRLVRPEGAVRELLGRTYNRLLQATITPGVVDTQCGAKAASRAVWAAILPACAEPGYAWDAEAVAVARALGIPIQEVPIDWRHDDRSKVRVARDGLAMVLATPRIWRRVTRLAAAPPRQGAEEVFDASNAALLSGSDTDHWWFRSKAALVATAARRVAATDRPAPWLADLGAGSGGVTTMLGWDPNRVVVVEGNAALVADARARHGLPAVRSHLDPLPLADGSVDVVCLLDVLEHLADPVAVLAEARRVLHPAGRVIVNVPAHRWLWSEADVVLGHRRRYTRASLTAELDAGGFRPRLVTHVFSWLVPPVWWRRRARHGHQPELGLDQTSPVLDRVAMALTLIERGLLGRVTLPFGTSVLAVADKAAPS